MSIIATGLITLMTVTAGLPEIMWFGDPVGSTSAVSYGMGESSFMDVSALGILGNPALLGLAPQGLLMELSAGVDIFVEKRTRRVYDQFESSIGESEIAFNKDLSFFPGGVAVAYRDAEDFSSSLAFAAGWRVPALFQYRYDRTVRNEAYVKTGEEVLEITGLRNEFDLAVAFIPSETFSFGLSAGYITGTRDVTWEVDWVDPTLDGTLSGRNESLSGMVTRGSVLYRPHPRVYVSAGVDYPMSMTISPENTGDPVTWNVLSDEEYDLDMPMTVRVGSIYVPGNILRSRVSGEFYWSDDSSMEFEGVDLGLSNSWGLKAGVENTLPGGPTARFGFGYHRSPVSSALDRMNFTAGLGFNISEWNLDLGASFSPDRWSQTEISGLPSFVSGDSLTVEETDTRIVFTLSRVFDL